MQIAYKLMGGGVRSDTVTCLNNLHAILEAPQLDGKEDDSRTNEQSEDLLNYVMQLFLPSLCLVLT